MLEIKIKKLERIENETGLLCLDDCIATICAFFDRDYEMMYIGGYNVFRSKDFFSKEYQLCLKDAPENLYKYHGVRIKKQKKYSYRKLKKRINMELMNGKPVMVLFDPYWCPWDEGYQKYSSNTGHCFIIRGMEKDCFYCLDPYYEYEDIKLPQYLFVNGIREVFFSSLDDYITVSEDFLKNSVNVFFKGLRTGGYFSTIYDFLGKIDLEDNLFENISLNENFWQTPDVIFLMMVNQSIQNVARVIKYIANQIHNEQLEIVYKHIWNLAVEWKQTRKLFSKLFFLKKEDEDLKNKTIMRMIKIWKEYENYAKQIEEGSWESNIIRKESTTNLKTYERIESQINISKFFNNKAFLKKKDEILKENIADFASVGTFYVWGDGVEYNNYLEGVKERIFANKYDNISCEGQIIHINPSFFCQISLIGASEFGDSTDIIKLIHDNNTYSEIEFQFTDYICTPKYGEEIVWKGKGAYREDGLCKWMEDSVYLFKKSYEIPEKRVKEIILPINPSVHIFAILFTGYRIGEEEFL